MQRRGNPPGPACLVGKVDILSPKGKRLRSVPCGGKVTVKAEIEICNEIILDSTLAVTLAAQPTGEVVYQRTSAEAGWDISYLPRGHYLLELQAGPLELPPKHYRLSLELSSKAGGKHECRASLGSWPTIRVTRRPWFIGKQAEDRQDWRLRPLELDFKLSWQQPQDDWFFKHFDHASRVIIQYMLDDSPLLQGRILDVGCGEGVTDLGVFLRKQPELLVGIDVEDNFRELPRIMRQYGIPASVMNKRLVFRQLDASSIPYPDSYFDVVISWGSLEHVAGGYDGVLKEVKRVLKDGGLFFVHPGLYYSSIGHHLGEFTQEPFAHLTKSEEELKEIVFTAKPNLMDRGGLEYTREDFWRYYGELNKITVSAIERELRELGFEFRKVAVRTEDLVTYNDKLQDYSIQDLTTKEIYMSLTNHKQ